MCHFHKAGFVPFLTVYKEKNLKEYVSYNLIQLLCSLVDIVTGEVKSNITSLDSVTNDKRIGNYSNKPRVSLSSMKTLYPLQLIEVEK